MNHSLLLSILLIEVSMIISICITMTMFILQNKGNRQDKEYRYYFGHLLSLDTLGISVTLFIFSIIFVTSDRNNNLWMLILAISSALYIVFWTAFVVRIFLILSNYELNKYTEKTKWENKLRYLYQKRNRDLHLCRNLAIAFVIFIVCAVTLYFGFKISLYWFVLAALLILVVAMIFALILVVRNVADSNISIKNTNNITIATVISISLTLALTAWGSISANAAMELPGAPNGLSKKMDDLENSNHKLELKLEHEDKINIQNKNSLKKVVKENHKTNINIKKITNNTTINRIMKSKPHDPHTPTKKSPSPKKPPYQDPKGKLPDTGEAKGFWQW